MRRDDLRGHRAAGGAAATGRRPGRRGHGSRSMSYTIGVDIGGTFTDCITIDGTSGRVVNAKALTTPHDRSEGFFASIEEAARVFDTDAATVLGDCELLVHGTTTGTNAILTRRGANVGLLATAGHGDVM